MSEVSEQIGTHEDLQQQESSVVPQAALTVPDARLLEGLQQLENQLHSVDPQAAARVKSLHSMVGTIRQHELAHLDLYSILNPEGIETRAIEAYQHWGWILSVVEWIRNFLVLLPVTLTWIGLSHAAASYKRAIEYDSALISQPFLLLWERGFDGHTTPLPGILEQIIPDTFSGLALVDFIILFILLILTVISHLWRDIIADHAYRRASALRQQVEKWLWELSQVAAAERVEQEVAQAALRVSDAVERFRVHAKELLNHMTGERQLVSELAHLRAVELGELGLFSNGLNESTRELARYLQEAGLAYERLHSVVDQLSLQVDEMARQQKQLLGPLDTIGVSSSAMVDSVRVIGQTMLTGVQDLNRAVSSNYEGTRVALKAADNLSELAAKILESEQTLQRSIVQSSNDNKKVLDGIQRTMQQVTGAAESIGKTAGALNRVGGELGALNRSSQLLEAVQILVKETQSLRGVMISLEHRAADPNAESRSTLLPRTPLTWMAVGLGGIIVALFSLGLVVLLTVLQ